MAPEALALMQDVAGTLLFIIREADHPDRRRLFLGDAQVSSNLGAPLFTSAV